MFANQSSISVTELVRSIKTAIELKVGEVWVEGEISNFKRQGSGHCYFTLKDEWAQISCVFFKGAAMKCSASPDNGCKVRLYAEVGVYEPRGQVQLVVKVMEELGKGNLQQQFEALKVKLKEEGLFDQERKKPLPSHPLSIGLITSPTGAVIEDMKHVFQRRAPWIQLYLYPVRVQGDEAAPEIVRAIKRWNLPDSGLPPVDLFIIARGGGSLEDLWAFNEEMVARAISSSHIPIISAIGHETDFTIADFVADLRAPTPTAAAELAAPEGKTLCNTLNHKVKQITSSLSRRLESYHLKLDIFSKGVLSSSPEKVLRDFHQIVDEQENNLRYSTETSIHNHEMELRQLALKMGAADPGKQIDWQARECKRLARLFVEAVHNALENARASLNKNEKLLHALGPQSAFKRGYSIVRNRKGQIIRDSEQVEKGEELTILLETSQLEVLSK